MSDDEQDGWAREVEEIARRRELAREMGGEDSVARQHAAGKLTVRERIESICDKGSFRERGGISGVPTTDEDGNLTGYSPANVVLGTAIIEGRRAVVCGDDFTLRGAAYTPASLRKGQYAEMLAIDSRVPLVRLLEAGGASVTGASGTRGRSGYDLVLPEMMNPLAMRALATVPVVCAALGPCAGFPAARLAAAHFSVMTKETAQVLTGGPALVARAQGGNATKEELGGAKVHAKSGVVDNVVADEVDALRAIRAFLSYMPLSVYDAPPRMDIGDSRERKEEALLDIVPRNRRRAFKMRKVIAAIVDRESFFEMGTGYGRSLITGLARVDGRSVGVLANDCYHEGGSMTAAGARKVRRFIELCDNFGLPIVSLVDEPGFAIGPDAEAAGNDPFRDGGSLRRGAVDRSMVCGAGSKVLWRRAGHSFRPRRDRGRVAVGRKRRAARRRGRCARVQARDRSGGGFRCQAPRTRRRDRIAAVGLPSCRRLRRARSHRSTFDASVAMRLDRRNRAAHGGARARSAQLHHPPVADAS